MSLQVQEMLAKMIKSMPLFQGIQDSEALELAASFNLNFIPQWNVLIEQNTVPWKIYIIKQWKMDVIKDEGGNKVKLAEIYDWDIVGEMSYFNNTKSMASVIAAQDSDVWEIGIHEFGSFLDKYLHIKTMIQEIINRRNDTNKQTMDPGANKSVSVSSSVSDENDPDNFGLVI